MLRGTSVLIGLSRLDTTSVIPFNLHKCTSNVFINGLIFHIRKFVFFSILKQVFLSNNLY